MHLQSARLDSLPDIFDDINPNTKGDKIMTERWFNAIKDYLKNYINIILVNWIYE